MCKCERGSAITIIHRVNIDPFEILHHHLPHAIEFKNEPINLYSYRVYRDKIEGGVVMSGSQMVQEDNERRMTTMEEGGGGG